MDNTETPENGSTEEVTWKSALPEDIKEDPSLGPIESVENLAKSYVSAQRMIGKDRIVVPGQYATDDDWKNNVFSKLGLPEKVDDYSIETGGQEFDENFFKGFKESAHEAGILPNQAQKLFNWYNEEAHRQGEEYTKQAQSKVDQAVNGLKTEWGKEYDNKVRSAQTAVNHFTDESFKTYLDDSGLGNHPELIKTFAKIGETLSEDTFQGEGPVQLGRTPSDAQAEINTVMADPNHPYHQKGHPNHEAAVADVQRLFQHL
jgi:hypothetical protein